MTSTPAGDDARSSWERSGLRVLVLVLGGIAINKLSDLVHASAPVILLGSVLALLAVLVYEARHDRGISSPRGRGIDNDADLAVFSLTNLVLGAIIGSLAVLPIFDEHAWYFDLESNQTSVFFNYEILAALTIASLAIVPAWRRRDPLQLAAFVIPTVSGMTLSLVTLKPGNDFLPTFITWACAVGLLVALVYLRTAISGIYRGFFARGSGSPPAANGSELEEEPATTPSMEHRQPGAPTTAPDAPA